MMRVHLLPFGILKEVLRPSPLELQSGATVADLLAVLGQKEESRAIPAVLLSSIAVSVNAEYARLGHVLNEGDEVGLLPPVSGGRHEDSGEVPPVITYLIREPIPEDALISFAKEGADGAVVVFDGIVRDNTRGRPTLYLDYEAYEEMAEKQMRALADQAIARFGIRAVTMVHRLGRVTIGESSVLIIVASAHRAAAYEASRWLIDTLKKTVPIWKKETFADGAVWADGEPFPPELAANPGGIAQASGELKP